jgi:hypothetical protein
VKQFLHSFSMRTARFLRHCQFRAVVDHTDTLRSCKVPRSGERLMKRWQYDGIFYRRRPTRTVHVGDVAVGSEHPIRVQSMTTPSTKDTRATVEQIRRLVDAGRHPLHPCGRDEGRRARGQDSDQPGKLR